MKLNWFGFHYSKKGACGVLHNNYVEQLYWQMHSQGAKHQKDVSEASFNALGIDLRDCLLKM